MAIHYIPIQQGEPNYRIGIAIQGVAYLMDVRWNVRDAAWYLDLYDQNEKPIRTGLKCMLGTYLGRTCNQSPFTDGVFRVCDTSGVGRDATFDDFGGRVQLVFIPTLDLLALYQKVGVK